MNVNKPNRREFLSAAGATVAATSGTAASLASAKSCVSPAFLQDRKPNFLYVICDQLGLDAVGAHGCTDVETPHLDRLIDAGTTFLESHSTNPVCSPARSSLMTGRMPVETGVVTNGRPIDPSCPTVGHVLESAGYDSVYCGKWHLPGPTPKREDGFRVFPARGGQGDIDDSAVSRTCEAFLRNRTGDQPYLMVASFLQPHDICFWGNHVSGRLPEGLPYPEIEGMLPELPPNLRSRPKAPAALDARNAKGRSDLQWRYYLYIYSRMVEMLDADVGRLLTALEETSQDDNTVVIFTSDHGDGRGRHEHVSKWYPYDEACKVPLSITCPDRIAARQDSTHLVSGLDIMSTICDMADVNPPERLQGRSLKPLLQQDIDVEWREFVTFDFQQQGHVLRSDQYKYVQFDGSPIEQLFDMKSDPWEMTNLYEDANYATVLADHRKMLTDYNATLRPITPTESVERSRPVRPVRPRQN